MVKVMPKVGLRSRIGKFDHVIDEYAYMTATDQGWSDGEFGSNSTVEGWNGLVVSEHPGEILNHFELLAAQDGEELTVEEKRFLRKVKAFWVTESGDGFTFVDYFRTSRGVPTLFEKAAVKYGDDYSEIGDDY